MRDEMKIENGIKLAWNETQKQRDKDKAEDEKMEEWRLRSQQGRKTDRLEVKAICIMKHLSLKWTLVKIRPFFSQNESPGPREQLYLEIYHTSSLN